MPPESEKRGPLERLLIVVLIVVIVIVFLLILYWALWPYSAPEGAGFAYDPNMQGPRFRTLWDWLGLLIVPVAVAVGAAVLSYVQKKTELDIAEKSRTTDREIAEARQRQATLEAYYDRMTELLLKHNLREVEDEAEERSIARARTIAVIQGLDAGRNRQLFAFLRESKLLEPNAPIVNLSGADLSGVDLNKVNLSGVDLSGANLSGADLRWSDLSRASLRRTNLSEALMRRADLSEANLRWANLSKADLSAGVLSKADLGDADLSDANLNMANLSKTNLSMAKLIGTSLSWADLDAASLHGVDLGKADLSSTRMPDGVRLKGPVYDGPTFEEWKKYQTTHGKV